MQNVYTLAQCYQILGLDPNKKNTTSEIKKAYHVKALLHHPDKNPNDPLSEEIFKKIKEAYEIITNPSFAHKQMSKASDLDIIINFNATFNDGFFGKNYTLNFNRSAEYAGQNNLSLELHPVQFNLPAGSSGLFQSHFSGKGFTRNLELGDLLIRVNITPHPHFVIQGQNVIANLNVPLSFFIKGGKLDVATLYGLRELAIPPGTIPGSSLTIPNCGVNKQNFHVAVLQVVYPTKDQLKSGVWNKLDINWNIQ